MRLPAPLTLSGLVKRAISYLHHASSTAAGADLVGVLRRVELAWPHLVGLTVFGGDLRRPVVLVQPEVAHHLRAMPLLAVHLHEALIVAELVH